MAPYKRQNGMSFHGMHGLESLQMEYHGLNPFAALARRYLRATLTRV